MTAAWNSKWLLLAAVVVLWGSSFALVKIAVATIPAVWVMGLRLAIAGSMLTGLLFAAGQRFPAERRSWTAYFAIAIVGNVVPFLLIAWGLNYIPSGLSGILMAVVPLGVVVLAHFFLPDEPLHGAKVLGFALGFLGVIVVLGPERLLAMGTSGREFWGEVAVIVAALCYSLQSIITRRLKARGALETAAAALVLAGTIGMALAIIVDPRGMERAGTGAILAVGVAGLFTTGLATVVFFQLIRVSGASFASLVNYLIPVYALCAGWIVLGEQATRSDALGLAMILCGIALAQRLPAPKTP